ncbi:MAG: AbrB family transcriptional regulator [Proteobacteria bacterium]|nr:AbrB family transcriptional regulator [Pseudomonadota bacterium]
MQVTQYRSTFITTAYTLVVGAVGAAIAYWLSFPVYILLGPAILVSVTSLFGFRFAIADSVRDVAFLLIGIGIGAGINPEATTVFLRWPLAFLVLAVMLVAILLLCKNLLVRFFGFDERSAILAATPGHLSFVLGLGAALDLDVAKVALVQSIRLLSLTILVPLVAISFGVTLGTDILPDGAPMQMTDLFILIIVSCILGLVLKRFNVPAAILIGGLITSSVGHALEYTPGILPKNIALPCFMIMGTLIGTRFSGITVYHLKSALFAGLATTFVSVLLAVIAAVPVSYYLGMPPEHVVVAFSPGGLETMIAMGAVLGANPSFIAACHVARLLLLPVLVPFLIGRSKKLPILP